MLDHDRLFLTPYLFFNFMDDMFFPNPVSLSNGCILMFLSCFISVSAFVLAKLKLFLCLFFKSLVIILLIFCCSDSAILNLPSRSKSQGRSEGTSSVACEVLVINCQIYFIHSFIFNC